MYEDKRIREALELLNDVAKEKRDDFQDILSHKYNNLKTALLDAAEKATHEAAYIFRAGKRNAKDLAHDVDKNIHRKPWSYIGGTAIGCLILGFLWGRRGR